jgi:NAD+ synthase (glutamine-hydrolysing)
MKISLAQLNPRVGDLGGNLARLERAWDEAAAQGADLVVTPELFLVGYPPRDLLDRPGFIAAVGRAVDRVVEMSASRPRTGLILGAPRPSGQPTGRGLYNSAVLIHDGRIVFEQAKSLLPTYDVFDEARYFDSATEVTVVRFADRVLGLSICEDCWNVPQFEGALRQYELDPVAVQVRQGAEIAINISASPFFLGKDKLRFDLFQAHARRHERPFIFVNQVGANDELIFDGRSVLMDDAGRPRVLARAFVEDQITVDVSSPPPPPAFEAADLIADLYQALVLGIRDYVGKCGFSKVILGLSGGIDSAVTCVLAAQALGPENVVGVTMPGPYSSPGSIEDSRRLTGQLGVRLMEIPIAPVFQAYLDVLTPHFENRPADAAEENIQARVRGNLLMALSNKFGYLVLSTGNKSELAVGYCTLYGDMSGGLAVISDVPKTMVYKLARYLNRSGEVIPEATITKPPSAELRPDQTDQDTLPDYDTLDRILYHYVDQGLSPDQIEAQGLDPQVVGWVTRTVIKNEYKRRQAAPGLKVTTKAFGVGRRMPIAARFDY